MADPNICKVDGCGKVTRGRAAFCNMHRLRLARTGEVGEAAARRAPNGEPEAFLRDALSRETNNCIHWPYARRNKLGYGAVNLEGRFLNASYAMCVLAYGEPPFPNAVAAHKCDNPSCVNPKHLWWATQTDNLLDAIAKGRQRLGEHHHRARLTANSVRTIRARLATTPQNKLAKEFRVSKALISAIAAGKIWKHVDPV